MLYNTFKIKAIFLEYKEDEELNKYSVLLRQRKYILCQKFFDKTKKKILYKSKSSERNHLTDMINVNLEDSEALGVRSKEKKIDSLDDYIASLDINEQVNFSFKIQFQMKYFLIIQDLDKTGLACNNSWDFALGGNWKEEVYKDLY